MADWVRLSAYPQHTHEYNPYFPCEASKTNSNVGMGEGCRLEDIYIYIYIYIYPPIYTPLPNSRWLHHTARYVRKAERGAYTWWKWLNSIKKASK